MADWAEAQSHQSLQGGDYGAALDVLADLQAGLAGDPLHGLACFRSVRCPAASAAETIFGCHALQSRCKVLLFMDACVQPAMSHVCGRHLPDQIAEAGASMHELIAADFLRGTAFTGLEAMADGVLATLRRVHHSAPPTTAGPSPDRRQHRLFGANRGRPTLCLHQVISCLPLSCRVMWAIQSRCGPIDSACRGCAGGVRVCGGAAGAGDSTEGGG